MPDHRTTFFAGEIVEFHNPPDSPYPDHPRPNAPGPYEIAYTKASKDPSRHHQIVYIQMKKDEKPVSFSGWWFRRVTRP